MAEALARLERLESEQAIRACMNRYMVLCDALDADTPLDELAGLFTEDALWRGKGARYTQSFGGYEGRDAIRAMFAKYMSTPPHFAVNVHFLTSELIEVQCADTARGSWVMLQTSTFSAGGSHLNAARLALSFRREADGAWRIAEFVTENLFSRPVQDWNDSAPLPVPR
ncbi:nuclear transport factor 2 family protein [Verticiella sediminum]|uniref:Nuclear transport factor 2 family protein n=1 Tax=Verticiella sediminum TaxID=1247510 RepID=A0A556AW74_9BURK|nr:nuclear transport factor 2 family protein [Verticiella sediminum]